jgi:outer membrane protein assembly factor BamE
MSEYTRRCARVLQVTLALVGLLACTPLPATGNRVALAVTPYKIDIVQGNVVTREQVAVLKPGMARSMVRDVLGTPLLADVFHGQRWDYVFTLQRQGAAPQSRKVTVFFNGDVLERIEADELPSESEFVSTLKSLAHPGPPPALEVPLSGAPKAAPEPKPVSPPAPAAPVNYPPLESPAK